MPNFKRSSALAQKADSNSKAQTSVVKLTHSANLASDEVLAFGFHYGKFEPSKYS